MPNRFISSLSSNHPCSVSTPVATLLMAFPMLCRTVSMTSRRPRAKARVSAASCRRRSDTSRNTATPPTTCPASSRTGLAFTLMYVPSGRAGLRMNNCSRSTSSPRRARTTGSCSGGGYQRRRVGVVHAVEVGPLVHRPVGHADADHALGARVEQGEPRLVIEPGVFAVGTRPGADYPGGLTGDEGEERVAVNPLRPVAAVGARTRYPGSTIAPLAEGGLQLGIIPKRPVVDVLRRQVRSVGPDDRPKLRVYP